MIKSLITFRMLEGELLLLQMLKFPGVFINCKTDIAVLFDWKLAVYGAVTMTDGLINNLNTEPVISSFTVIYMKMLKQLNHSE